MPGNEHFAVGSVRAVVAIKAPASATPEQQKLLAQMDIFAQHGEDYALANCTHARIADLRDAGLEVIVVAADGNEYAYLVMSSEGGSLTAEVDQRIARGRDDMAIADAGRRGGSGEGA